jgi:hypothetical protein
MWCRVYRLTRWGSCPLVCIEALPLGREVQVPSAKQRWLILFSALVIIGFQVGLFNVMQRFQARKPDFAALYQAGRALDHERFPDLFTRFPSLNSDGYKLWLNAQEEYPSDAMHPPYEMIIYGVLALFKFRIAYPLWWACNLGCLFMSVFLLSSHIPRLNRSYPYLLILVATFFPLLVALVQGQNTVLLLALLTLSYCSLEKHHDFRAGFLLAMGMFKFVLVIPMAFWLILEKRWRSLAGFISGCVVLFFIALWLVGFGGIETYIRQVVGYGKKAPEEPGTEAIMPNLRGLFHAAGSGIAPEIWLTILTLVASIALLVWVDARLSRYKSLSFRFSIQVLLAVMISYHLYPHDGAVLVLPILMLLDCVAQDSTERVFKIVVLTCAICAYLVPLVAGLYIGMPVIGAAGLALLIAARNQALKTPVLSAAPARS